MMDRQLKQRVVGAAVLVVLGVIFIPIFLDHDALETRVPELAELPPPPDAPYESRVEPIDEDDMLTLERAMEEPLAPPVDSMPGAAEEVAAKDAAEHDVTGTPPAEAGTADITAAAADTGASVADAAKPAAAAAEHAARGAPAPGAGWCVQLGSFAEQDNASRLVAKLEQARLPGYVQRSTENGASIWKVRVGPVIAREEAEQLRAQLARDFGLEGLLLRYP